MVVTTRAVADGIASSTGVAPVSVLTDPSAARKRRREKLTSQRQSQMTPPATLPLTALGKGLSEHVASAASSTTTITTTTVEEEEEAAAVALLDATLLDDVLPLPLTVESSSGMDLDMDDLMMDSPSTSASESLPSASALPKRRRVSNCLMEDSSVVKTLVVSDASCNKKPQMKYDPPPEMAASMTKEEAALWRREQRRKRNRESAAASRQRQRSRISELEVELSDWKGKVQSVLDRIASLEAAAGLSATDAAAADVAFGVPLPPHVDEDQLLQDQDPQDQDPLHEHQDFDELVAGAVAAEQLLDVVLPVPPVGILTIDIPSSSKVVSPPASPGRSSPLSSDDESSPTSTLSTGIISPRQGLPGVVVTAPAGQREGGTRGTTKAKEHYKMISRHAVS